jgi:DNA polymerase-3 subunit gamma/tau
MSERKPRSYDQPSPLPKLPPDAPPGAKYQLGNGIFVDDLGMEVKPIEKPVVPAPNPAPAPAPAPASNVVPQPYPAPQPVPQGK